MSSPRQAPAPPADLRRYSRWLLALLLPVGPASVAVLRYVLPYGTVDSSTEIVRQAAANEQGLSLVLWLAFVGTFTLIPGVLAVGRLTRRRAPRTTAAALLLLIPGYLSLGWLLSSDILLWTGVHAGVDQPTMVRLYEQSHLTLSIAIGVFVLGHVIGTVLLGIALWRSYAVPRWAAVLTMVAQPLHFTAAVIVGSPELDLAAWSLNAVGFAAAAAAILRMRDDDWDLPPGMPTGQTMRAPAAMLSP